MTFDIDEIKKIFNFILTNKNIILNDNGLFSRDTLIIMNNIIMQKKPNDFVLSKDQEKALIASFLNSFDGFDENTPTLIIDNKDCLDLALNNDIYSINYIHNYNKEMSQRILKIVHETDYVLSENSPDFLKKDYKIAKRSIKKDVNSANYVSWEKISKNDCDNLIKDVIDANYLITKNSPSFLKNNIDLVLYSLNKDISLLEIIPNKTINHPEVFKYLISVGHDFNKVELRVKPVSSFTDIETMKYTFNKLGIFENGIINSLSKTEKDKYIYRITELFVKALNTPPTIKSFKTIFEFYAEEKWNDYMKENINDYANIFGKICSELKNIYNYNDIYKLSFIHNMEKVLGDKYNLLIEAMEEYHRIIHSSKEIDNIDYSRDQISKLSALYIAKSKEKFKKEIVDSCLNDLKSLSCFIPKKDNPVINKILINRKYKEELQELYNKKDTNICNFINNIISEYNYIFDKDTLLKIIDGFIKYGYSRIDNSIDIPDKYYNYVKYKEACKLVNRLNNNYINYIDQEVNRYTDIIKYDENNNKYYYDGPIFDQESINEFDNFEQKIIAFEKIKQRFIIKAKELEIDLNITDIDFMTINNNIPFNDDYYEFKQPCEYFNLKTLLNACLEHYIEINNILDDEAYNILTKYIINNDLIWLLMILFKTSSFNIIDIDSKEIIKSFNKMEKIMKFTKLFDYDINKYEDILSLYELSNCADDETLAILGKDIIFKLQNEREYTRENTKTIVQMARDLICGMAKRSEWTVPFIEGKYGNYEYSMYDSLDETLLLAGINTDACFRVDGNDNDFLHYCALDKNGFVIKITDSNGNFIARASGFRNGNCVFINQLRTIYDSGGNGYKGYYENEKNGIIETFYKACNVIVNTSKNNKEEVDKIEYVFVTKSYILEDIKSNVTKAVRDKIGYYPMENESEDWKSFVQDTIGLSDMEDEDDYFVTDYGSYSLICVSPKKPGFFGILKPEDIKSKDVPALYNRKRSKIIITDNPDTNIINKMNKINGMDSYFNYSTFESVNIPEKSTIMIGDNWYIIYNNNSIINSRLLIFDKKATIEFNAAKKIIEDNINKDLEKSEIHKILDLNLKYS